MKPPEPARCSSNFNNCDDRLVVVIYRSDPPDEYVIKVFSNGKVYCVRDDHPYCLLESAGRFLRRAGIADRRLGRR